MTLEERITSDIKDAMKAKDQGRLEALRAIKSSLLLLKTSGEAVNEDSEIKTLQKMVKQRREAAEIYDQQGRKDLAEVETTQAAVIEEYLPKQLSEEKIREEVKRAIEETGASSAAEMGKVMGVVTKRLAGRADGKTVSAIVKQMLS